MAPTLAKISATVFFGVALASCGGSNVGSGAPMAPSATSFTISVLGDRGSQSFNPNPAPAGGQAVVFRNTDGVTHHMVLNDGSLDTGDLAPGATSRILQMPAIGANYHCSIHPGMIGSVGAASGGAPPPCNDPGYC